MEGVMCILWGLEDKLFPQSWTEHREKELDDPSVSSTAEEASLYSEICQIQQVTTFINLFKHFL